MRTLVVQTYPGANDAVFRHYPYWKKGGADRIVGLVTDDGACKWPTEDMFVAGPNRYVDGAHLPNRLVQSLEIGIASGADDIVVIEYDAVFFKPLPKIVRDGIAMLPTGGSKPGYKCRRYFHNPWQMNAETAKQVIAAAKCMIALGEIENGMPDCFIGRLVDLTDIPTIENAYTRYTQNTIQSPAQLEDARKAYRAGVHAMHGIKTKEQLQFIVSN